MLKIRKFAQKLDSVNEHLGKSVAWLTLILVLVVCYDVVTRYLFKSSSVAIGELQWHLFAVIFLLGAGYTLKYDDHVRVDVLFSKFTRKTQAIINLIGTIIFLLPFCVIVIYASKNFVFTSFQIGETSPDPGGLPARYILKAILPISFLFLILQGISLILKSLITIKSSAENE